LLVDNLQRSKVGNYVVRVRHTQSGDETFSDPTSVQINITDGHALEVAALDKFPEKADNVRSGLAVAGRLQKATLGSSPIRKLSGGPARGYRGTRFSAPSVPPKIRVNRIIAANPAARRMVRLPTARQWSVGH